LKKSLFPRNAIFYVLLLVVSVSLFVNVSVANETTPSPSVDIQVDHALEIGHGGLIVINDTVRLSTQPGENADSLQDFRIGFPFDYKSNLEYCFAYDTAVPEKQLDVVLDAGLGRINFYGVNVIFSEPVDVSDGKSYSFTVVFVFSDLITPSISPIEPDTLIWNATFLLYPSLPTDASICLDTPTNGHMPKNMLSTKLLTNIALTIISKISRNSIYRTFFSSSQLCLSPILFISAIISPSVTKAPGGSIMIAAG